eukprot:TRINITY_DN3200_c0_g1_i1.p1 TRINITY_DN3200_c0_g1~~TRINITY_DN3200_c0_g1_i1.p1  ORF type:complete len:114 (-),score=16.69 TRINITY_DN3200_c0_g1_i1:1509-1850(-)
MKPPRATQRSRLQRVGEAVTNALGGVRGRTSLLSWTIAGAASYYLWIRPEWQRREELEAKALLRQRELELQGARHIEKTRPIRQAQGSGLVKGSKTGGGNEVGSGTGTEQAPP